MTSVDTLDAEKTLKPVFPYVFRIAFTASLFAISGSQSGNCHIRRWVNNCSIVKCQVSNIKSQESRVRSRVKSQEPRVKSKGKEKSAKSKE